MYDPYSVGKEIGFALHTVCFSVLPTQHSGWYNPLAAAALGESWPPQQPVSIVVCLSSSLSTPLSSLLSSLLQRDPSQTRSSSSSSYKQSSFHHLPWHRFHFHSLYMSQPPHPLSFYEFHNILSVYGSHCVTARGKTVKTMAGLHTPQGCADFRNNSDATTKNSSRQKGDIQEVPHRGLEFLYVRKKNELE